MKPTLITDKIILKAPEKSDATDLYHLRTDPAVNRFLDRDPPKDISDVEKFIEQRNADENNFYFIIKTMPGAAFAGTICLWNINKESKYAEIGYELLPGFQGKGIMTSALRELINFAFTELNIETIEAFTHIENFPSKKLLENSGFKPVADKVDPGNSNIVVYCLRKLM